MATNETATGQGGHTGDASQAVFVGADIFDRPLSAVRGTSGSVIVMRPADDDPDNEADAVVSFSGDTAARLAEWIRPGMADPADTIRELRESVRDANAETVRLRATLNRIAWPASFGGSATNDTIDFYRHIAQDTLAIGSKVCNDRATAARREAGGGE